MSHDERLAVIRYAGRRHAEMQAQSKRRSWIVRHRATAYGVVVAGIAAVGMAVATFVCVALPDVTRVVFLNVGQGDGILITRGAHQILIDGGADGALLQERLAEHMPFWDRTIDVMIATHPDTDHIGAQVAVLRGYGVGVVIATDAFKQSSAATAWHSALERNRAQVMMADASIVVRLAQGDDAAGVLRVVYPRVAADVAAAGDDTNAASVVTRLDVAGTSFLMTGDLPQEQERFIPSNAVTVLKVGHHGSKYSTTDDLLARVRPRDAVVSVGVNRYGHPAPEAMERLAAAGADILRTDQKGSISYTCTTVPTPGCGRDTDR